MPAVYELFSDKDGLLRAVFFERFRRLGTELVAITETADALADLARWHDGVALALALGQSGPRKARAAARAVLDGDRAAVAALAKALEQKGDPRAVEVRAWQNDKPRRRGRGKVRRTDS